MESVTPQKLDVWISESQPEMRERIQQGFTIFQGVHVIAEGFAPGYWNIMAACHPDLYQPILDRLVGLEGIYVNKLPPEIQAEMDADDGTATTDGD